MLVVKLCQKISMKSSFSFHTVLLFLHALNYVMLILPMVCLLTVYIIILSKKSKHEGNIPFISDLDPSSLESRIATSFNSIELVIVSIMIFFRHRVMEVMQTDNAKFNQRRFHIVFLCMRVIIYFALVGNLLTVFFNYSITPIMHSIGIFFMYNGYALYLFLNDIACKALGRPSKDFSKIISATLAVSAPSFVFIRFIFPAYVDLTLSSIASVIGLITYACLYIKLFISKYDLPEYGIRVSKQIVPN